MSPRKKENVPRAAKTITDAMATWSFIACFVCLFAAWAGWNNLAPARLEFDKYPFILFNLFLSFIAAIQGSVIMIYQKYADAERDKLMQKLDRQELKLIKLEQTHAKELSEIKNILLEVRANAS